MFSIQENCEEAKTKVEWDKALEKGDRVAVNQYMQSISKDLTQMHKILSNVLPKTSIETIFGQIFQFLMRTFDDFFSSLNVRTNSVLNAIIDLNQICQEEDKGGLEVLSEEFS